MRRIWSVALLVAALGATPVRAAHSESREYVAGTGDAVVLLCSERPSLGGACFDVPGAHASARIRVVDDTALPVGGAYRFEASDGTALSRGSFCRQTTAAIPAGARTLTVFVDSVRSPLDCPPVNGEVPGVGTTGEVVVAWLTTPPAGDGIASPVIGEGASAIAGSGRFGGMCLTIAGAVSHDAGRQRWNASLWTVHPGPTTAGICDEEVPHTHLEIRCAEGAGPELFLFARGTEHRTDYLVRVWDGGPDEPDHAGVIAGPTGADRCGASEVPLAPVDEGAFVVTSAP